MSVLDQLSNVANSIESSVESALGLSPDKQYYYNTFGGKNHILIQPLDVSSSRLFQNLGTNGLKTKNYDPKTNTKDETNHAYPLGFTPDLDTYLNPNNIDNTKLGTTYPVERGNILDAGILEGPSDASTPRYGQLRNTNDILDNNIPDAFEAFNDVPGEEFLHHLDKDQIPISLQNINDIYLSSYANTPDDNEDPISFGYDIIINFDNSPLFNGAIEDFINSFSGYTELKSRLGVISEFKNSFFKFFKVTAPSSANVDSKTTVTNLNTYYTPVVRTYYLKKLAGLDNLTEAILPDKSKQFVNYGTNDDVLTLTLNEDVSVNMGYLASLYKILSYSKVNGKKLIPDNLLRFDMEIVVTEARKFNRVNQTNNQYVLDQYADLISRYRYTLYECQFFFDKMSHGDTIDMWGLETSTGFDLKINYKFSTVNFEKIGGFDFNTDTIKLNNGSGIYLNNSKTDLTDVKSNETNKFTIDNSGSLLLGPIEYAIEKYSGYAPNSDNSNSTSEYRGLYKAETTDDFYRQRLEKLNNTQNSNFLNLRDALLQKTLDNINQQVGGEGLIGSLLGSLINTNIVGGFTEDGYEYNVPAHYANKIVNSTNNLIGGLISNLVSGNSINIYEQKALLEESLLMDVTKGINNFVSNLLGFNGGNGVGDIYKNTYVPNRDSGTKLNIYGNSTVKPINYTGDYIANPNPPDTPPHHSGKTFDIYNRKKEYPDTPPHHFGSPGNIYNNKKEYPDTPPHHLGTPISIYANSKIFGDTPPHHFGSVFDIYNNNVNYPDTPPHTFGVTTDIYLNSKLFADTPPHTYGSALNIYSNNVNYPDTPPHTFGSTFDIYKK